jgi:hypothetical protein
MNIDWDADVLHIDLVPEGRPLGRSAQRVTVFREYGDSKARFVQAFASKLGGEIVYVEASKGAKSRTIPVTGWRNPNSTPVLAVAEFVEDMMRAGCTIACYGSSRVRWRLTVHEEKTVEHDLVDNATDSSVADSERMTAEVTEENGLRVAF